MVRSCAAFSCTNRFSKDRPNVHFFRFPFTRPVVLKKWVTAMRRKDWQPTKASTICSDHFLPQDFQPDEPGSNKKRLKTEAVPSKFNFSPVSAKKEKAVKSIPKPKKEMKKIQPDSTVEIKQEIPDDDFLETNRTICSDNSKSKLFNSPDSEEELDNISAENDSDNSSGSDTDSNSSYSEKSLKQKLEVMTTLYVKTRKKLRLCQEQCKRYVKQVIALEEVIDNLKQINSVTDYN